MEIVCKQTKGNITSAFLQKNYEKNCQNLHSNHILQLMFAIAISRPVTGDYVFPHWYPQLVIH
jgi:hypothetical protein